jgi:organic radical activating enzyme
MKENKIYYSEIFGNTIQGEGQYTGVPTVWIRFFLCNLECAGFGQDTPSKPETYKSLESKLIDLVNITDIKDLPVFEYGCDSAYSVAKRYKHLQKHETVSEIVDRIQALLPDGKFFHSFMFHNHFSQSLSDEVRQRQTLFFRQTVFFLAVSNYFH